MELKLVDVPMALGSSAVPTSAFNTRIVSSHGKQYIFLSVSKSRIRIPNASLYFYLWAMGYGSIGSHCTMCH